MLPSNEYAKIGIVWLSLEVSTKPVGVKLITFIFEYSESCKIVMGSFTSIDFWFKKLDATFSISLIITGFEKRNEIKNMLININIIFFISKFINKKASIKEAFLIKSRGSRIWTCNSLP